MVIGEDPTGAIDTNVLMSGGSEDKYVIVSNNTVSSRAHLSPNKSIVHIEEHDTVDRRKSNDMDIAMDTFKLSTDEKVHLGERKKSEKEIAEVFEDVKQRSDSDLSKPAQSQS